jgi:hypothetical protein
MKFKLELYVDLYMSYLDKAFHEYFTGNIQEIMRLDRKIYSLRKMIDVV